MHYSVLLSATALLLAGCVSQPTEEPVCKGNTLRGCRPVVYFDTGSALLTKKAKSNLDWAYNKMVRFPREHVVVTGYADSAGDAGRNFVLSKQRAMAVRDYFVKKGIEADRITVAFQGEFEPVCTKAVCQHLNRRAELDLSKPNGGWEPVDWEKISSKLNKIKPSFGKEE